MAPSASTTLQADDKSRIKKTLPSSTHKIITSTVARVYTARQGEEADGWAYAGVQGALTFCIDKNRGGLWFKLVDLLVSGCRGSGVWGKIFARSSRSF